MWKSAVRVLALAMLVLLRADDLHAQCFEIQKLFASDGLKLDDFGTAVALRGSMAVVSSINQDYTSPGRAYVFRFEPASRTWQEVQILSSPGGVAYDQFGFSLALSPDGNRLLVGAQGDSHAYFYRYDVALASW